MWTVVLFLLVGIGSYFWDIGVDVLVAREQTQTIYGRFDVKGESLFKQIARLVTLAF